MKILHTSDWHLGQHFYRFDRDDEHKYFIDQLVDIVGREKPDALVVSGDIFHTSVPPVQSQHQLVDALLALSVASPSTVIAVTAGNHDSGSRLEAHRALWERVGIRVVGSCERCSDGTFDPEQFILHIPGKGYVITAPFFFRQGYPMARADVERDDRLREYYQFLLDAVAARNADGLPVVMMAHLAVAGSSLRGHEDAIGGMVTEPIDDLGEGYDYLALGHIHMPQRLSDRAYYSGSPLPISFNEDYQHSVNVVEISAHGDKPHVQRIDIQPLRRIATLPQGDDDDLDAGLRALSALADDDTAYVRLLVSHDGILPADIDNRAYELVKDKACRFCGVSVKPKTAMVDSDLSNPMEISQIKMLSPMDIAKRAYRRAYNADMSDRLADLLQSAIDEVTRNQ